MITGIKSNRILFPDGIKKGYVYISGDKILYAGCYPKQCDELLDFGDMYVSPGFIDMHTHGAVGYSFLLCNSDEALKVCDYHMKHGTTAMLPTVSAAPIEQVKNSLAMFSELKERGICPISIPGVHLEGPYLDTKQCGAQLSSFITPPKPEDYIPIFEQYGKYILRWTYAPENDADQQFCKYITSHGIIPSVGHSNATYEQLLPAYELGCRLVTHLYSCTSTITRDKGFRHLGITEAAYLLDDMDVELIADGKHLPPELMKMIFKCKDHSHIALITDSLAAAGQDSSIVNSSDLRYIIEDGVCKLRDRSAFAGSIATTNLLVRNVVDAGCDLSDAVKMASAVPARILGLPKGQLSSGLDADIIVFDDSISVKAVFAMGKRTV